MTDTAHLPDPMQRGQWRQSSSLGALRGVLNASAHVNSTIARRAGMSVSELLALAHLSIDRIGPAEVARRLSVSTAASTGIVDKLVARGYVDRSAHPGDRRRTELVISEAGREAIVRHMVPMFLAIDTADRELDDHEREIVTRYLVHVKESFDDLIANDATRVEPPAEF